MLRVTDLTLLSNTQALAIALATVVCCFMNEQYAPAASDATCKLKDCASAMVVAECCRPFTSAAVTVTPWLVIVQFKSLKSA
jgi:hypothetical protein